MDLPKPVATLPGMTSPTERDCLFRAASALDVPGAVVDVGCWLGSLTASLVAGLRNNPDARHHDTVVHAFDTFRWEEWMNTIAAAKSVRPLSHGDDFAPLFWRYMSPWADRIVMHRAEADGTLAWQGDPIALLSIDAMKNAALTMGMTRMFFPSLVRGSLVFQQDFAWYAQPSIHLLQWRLRHWFELAEDVPSGGILCRLVEPIPSDAYDAMLDFSTADDAEWEHAFRYAESLVAPEKRGRLEAVRVYRLLSEQRADEAADLYRRYEARGSIVGTDNHYWQQSVAPRLSRHGSSSTRYGA